MKFPVILDTYTTKTESIVCQLLTKEQTADTQLVTPSIRKFVNK